MRSFVEFAVSSILFTQGVFFIKTGRRRGRFDLALLGAGILVSGGVSILNVWLGAIGFGLSGLALHLTFN